MNYNQFIAKTREKVKKDFEKEINSKPIGEQGKAIIERLERIIKQENKERVR